LSGAHSTEKTSSSCLAEYPTTGRRFDAKPDEPHFIGLATPTAFGAYDLEVVVE